MTCGNRTPDTQAQRYITYAWLAAMIALPLWFIASMLPWVPYWLSGVMLVCATALVILYATLERKGDGPFNPNDPFHGFSLITFVVVLGLSLIPQSAPPEGTEAEQSTSAEGAKP